MGRAGAWGLAAYSSSGHPVGDEAVTQRRRVASDESGRQVCGSEVPLSASVTLGLDLLGLGEDTLEVGQRVGQQVVSSVVSHSDALSLQSVVSADHLEVDMA